MLALVAFLLLASASTDPQRELTGVVERFLTPGWPDSPVFCTPATDAERSHLADTAARGDRMWACSLFCMLPPGQRAGLLVERRGQKPTLFVDVNRDGRFTKDERYKFPRSGDLVVRLPPNPGATVEYPVAIRLASEEWTRLAPPHTRVVLQSWLAVYRGRVTIDGRAHRLEYSPDWETLAPTTRNSWMGFDTNGDGRVEQDVLSPERLYARSDGAVFRVGTRFFSTAAIDPVTGTVTLTEHPSADYRRIELSEGVEIPDFAFSDLSGERRQLSDIAGRLTLLMVWAPWCPPAVDELRHVEHAFQTLGPKGLAVLGLPESNDVASLEPVISTHHVTWPNATPPSVRQLLEDRFRLSSNPVLIVVDSQRRIVAASRSTWFGERLRGAKITSTLEQLLKRATH